MKKLLTIFSVLCVFFFLASCSAEEDPYYAGDSLLLFPTSSDSQLIFSGSTKKDIKITYGTTKQVDADQSVDLVFDKTGSTAVEGVDFQIISKPSILPAGSSKGEFVVRLLEAGATQAGKIAKFHLKSSTLKNANFDQDFTLTIGLTCAVSNFVGLFNNTENWWYDNPGEQFSIQESTTTTNQLLVKNFYDVGRDLVLNYNPTTFVITVPDQYTGAKYGAAPYAGAEIWARPSTDPSQISSFNPCTRVLTLYANYYLKGTTAGFGNQKEVFTGL